MHENQCKKNISEKKVEVAPTNDWSEPSSWKDAATFGLSLITDVDWFRNFCGNRQGIIYVLFFSKWSEFRHKRAGASKASMLSTSLLWFLQNRMGNAFIWRTKKWHECFFETQMDFRNCCCSYHAIRFLCTDVSSKCLLHTASLSGTLFHFVNDYFTSVWRVLCRGH